MPSTRIFTRQQRQRIVREPNIAEKQVYAKHIRAGAAAAVDGGVPAIVLSTTAAAGSATTLIRTDATIIAFDATGPTTSAPGDTSATGAASVAARRDHRHGREAFGAVVTEGGGAKSDGVATTVSRSDHTHGFGFSSQAAGDLFQAASVSTLARLGLGSALALLRVNAGATAVEWGSAGQIAFPATQNASANANTLDDYEEGTWTPAVGGTATYTTQTGTYTKVGRVVMWFMAFKINAIGNGSQTIISGLPFSPATNAMNAAAYWSGLAATIVYLGSLSSGTSIVLYSATAATATLASNNVLGNSAEVIMNGIFEV